MYFKLFIIKKKKKVNAGPLAYAEAFLGDKENDYKPDKTKALKAIFLFVSKLYFIARYKITIF